MNRVRLIAGASLVGVAVWISMSNGQSRTSNRGPAPSPPRNTAPPPNLPRNTPPPNLPRNTPPPNQPNLDAARQARQAQEAAAAARQAQEAAAAARQAREAAAAARQAREAREAAAAARQAREAAEAAKAAKAAREAKEAAQAAKAAREAKEAAQAAKAAKDAAEAAKAAKAAKAAQEAAKAAKEAKAAKDAAEAAKAAKAAKDAQEAAKAAKAAKEAAEAAKAAKAAKDAAEAAKAAKAAKDAQEAAKAAKAAKDAREAAAAAKQAREGTKPSKELDDIRKAKLAAYEAKQVQQAKQKVDAGKKVIARLPADSQKKIADLRAQAAAQSLKASKRVTDSKAVAKPSKTKPPKSRDGTAPAGLGLLEPPFNAADANTLISVLGPNSPILNNLKNGQPLPEQQRLQLQNDFNNINDPTKKKALADALAADTNLKNKLNNPPPGSTVIMPNNPIYPSMDGYITGPAAWYPTDPGQPDGPGIVTSLNCEYPPLTGDGGLDSIVGDTPDVDISAVAQAVSPVQRVRYLRLANATKATLTVYVQYRTYTQEGSQVWFPGAPRESVTVLKYTLEPGEVADIQDDNWRINGTQARVWAESDDGQKWDRFKDQDLWLVPEKIEDGSSGYYAAAIETVNLVLR